MSELKSELEHARVSSPRASNSQIIDKMKHHEHHKMSNGKTSEPFRERPNSIDEQMDFTKELNLFKKFSPRLLFDTSYCCERQYLLRIHLVISNKRLIIF